MGFRSCHKADADVWMKEACKKNGFKYYEYILVYVDDLLIISHQPKLIGTYLQTQYRFKDEPAEPTRYLGADIEKLEHMSDPDKTIWGMSSYSYVKDAIKTVELELALVKAELPRKCGAPLPTKYRPEVDISPLLNDDQANYYQQLIGILRWAVELGRIDICYTISVMSSFSCAPRVGHLEALIHTFGFLKTHLRDRVLCFDDDAPCFETLFNKKAKVSWTDFYPDAVRHDPLDMPTPRGNPVSLTLWTDADHAGDRKTRRSHSGIFVFLNKALIFWYSKKQTTIETAVFGSEYVAGRIGVDLVDGLLYKIQMMGVPLDGPVNMFIDNESVTKNSTVPESMCKKKHISVAYHRMREAVAAGWLRIAHIKGVHNLADILTKSVPANLLHGLCGHIFWKLHK